MFFEIARVLKAKRPKYFLLENVKGLLNHDEGKTFRVILQTLDELGYEYQWMVLNSKFFGVPQNRERVFIVGNIRGTSRPEILPFGETKGTHSEAFKASEEVDNIASTMKARDYQNWNGNYIQRVDKENHMAYRVYDSEGLAPALRNSLSDDFHHSVILQHLRDSKGKTIRYNKRSIAGSLKQPSGNKANYVMIQSHSPRSGNPKKGGTGPLRSSDYSFTIDSTPHNDIVGIIDKKGNVKDRDYAGCDTAGGHSGGNHSDMDLIVQPVLTPNRLEKRQNGRRFKENGEPMFNFEGQDVHGIAMHRVMALDLYNNKAHSDRTPALTEPHHNSLRLQVGTEIRRLTPRECARLQGFPDDFEFNRKIYKELKLFGNVWDAKLMDVEEILLSEKNNSVLCTINDGENGEILKLLMSSIGKIKDNVQLKGVIEIVSVENFVQSITLPGIYMVMLCKSKETPNIGLITKKNLILDRITGKSTYKLLKITLEEKSLKEKLFITLTLIKGITESKIFMSVMEDENITNVILLWKKLQPNLLKRELLNLKTEIIIPNSDSQAYKQLGNAVTINVVEAIIKRIT